MDAEQRAAMEARHQPSQGTTGPLHVGCSTDGGDWPCDARQALDGWKQAEDYAQRDYSILSEEHGVLIYQRDDALHRLAAEEALARRLAGLTDVVMGLDCAFDDDMSPRTCFVHNGEWPSLDRPCEWVQEANAALAAYRERHPEEGT